VTRLWAKWSRFDSWQSKRFFLLATVPRLDPGSTQIGREADHSPPCSAKVRNKWTYTSTLYMSSTCGANKYQGPYLQLTLWHQNPKVHHHIHNSPPLAPILSRLNPFHTPLANHPKIHSDPILSSTSGTSKWSLSFWFSHQNLVHFSHLFHASHMPHPPHPPWLDLPNCM
jgi:hypothetical protein